MRAAVIVILLSLCAGCSSWPWSNRPQPQRAPVPVIELVAIAPTDAPMPTFAQYWQRNTLVIDLQNLGGTGRMVLAPRPGGSWPVRLAFRVRPGSFEALEVRAEQRVVLPIAAEGSSPVDLEIAPGVYTPRSERLDVAWGPMGLSPPAADARGSER